MRYKILRIISTLNPRAGGPQAGLINSSNELCKAGFLVDILTSDKENFHKNKSNKFNIIKLRINNVSYNFSFKIIQWLFNNKDKYDFFIIDGIWEFNSLIARIILKKNYYVFTHGEIDPYFSENSFKKIKKQIYWYLIEKKNLLRSNGILITGKSEYKMIKNTFVDTKGIKIHDIGYPAFIKKINTKKINYKKIFLKEFPKLKNKKYILFIGRIHHKKGCDLLLDAILKVKNLKNFYFLIIGFQHKLNNYEKSILNKINQNKKLKYRVIVSKFVNEGLKIASFKFSQATILPSRGENFGVVVTESLSLGKIPLITNKVGIYHEIKKFNAGIICRDNIASISNIIENFLNLKKEKKKIIEKNCLYCFNKVFNISQDKNKLIQLLKSNVK